MDYFDDTLETVLASDMASDAGKQSAWRQLVDLLGRRRVPPDPRAIAVLESIRPAIPLEVRAGSVRALEYADPPAALVRLVASDYDQVAAPVLRSARLTSTEWIALLGELRPAGRAILRHRRDLAPSVREALESFAPVDFVIEAAPPPAEPEAEAAAPPVEPEAAPQSVPFLLAGSEPPAVSADAATTPPDWAELPPTASEVPATSSDDAALPSLAELLAALPPPPGAEAVNIPGWSEVPGSVAPDVPEPAAVEAVPESAPAQAADEPTYSTPPVAPAPAPSVLTIDWTDVLAARPPVPELLAAQRPSETSITTREAAPAAAPASIDWTEVILARPPIVEPLPPAEPEVALESHVAAAADAELEPEPPAEAPVDPPEARTGAEGFVPIGVAALAIPIVADALARQVADADPDPVDQSGTDRAAEPVDAVADAPDAAQDPLMEAATLDPEPVAAAAPPEPLEPVTAVPAEPQPAPPAGPFEIADVVARIDAFWQQRESQRQPLGDDPAAPPAPAQSFRFETDSRGVIRWVEGVSRAATIGLSIDHGDADAERHVDGAVAGAFRQRTAFTDARLIIPGQSDAAGSWRISAVPVFDPATGRFDGFRGTARRPRADERAERDVPHLPAPAFDSLRQLVHELRTPTNAITGFAEMIEHQVLGEVDQAYRTRARLIRAQARSLLGAIDDLDLAARIESDALALYPDAVRLRGLLVAIAEELAPLCAIRGSWIALPVDDVAVRGDRRAVERLFARLLATLASASSANESIGVRASVDGEGVAAIAIDRPRALRGQEEAALLALDDEQGEAALLGTGFALRLARNLARELGGGFTIEAESLTVRLPAALSEPVEQVSNH